MIFRGSRPCRSSCQNLPHIDHIEDELTRDLGPINGFYLGNTSLALSRNLNLGPALVPILILTLVPTLVPTLLSSNELFKQFMKAYLESNQGPRQLSAERKQFFKAKMPDVCYRKLHIDYYHFC